MSHPTREDDIWLKHLAQCDPCTFSGPKLGYGQLLWSTTLDHPALDAIPAAIPASNWVDDWSAMLLPFPL